MSALVGMLTGCWLELTSFGYESRAAAVGQACLSEDSTAARGGCHTTPQLGNRGQGWDQPINHGV
jgi:hypothetical protein